MNTTVSHTELRYDAGIGPLQTLTGVAGTMPVFPPVARHEVLEGFPLRDVVNDTRSRPFCGPTAVASIVGQPVSFVRDAFRLVRHGSGWIDRDRAPAIKGTWHREVEAALRLFGYFGRWRTIDGKPTLAAFLEQRQGNLRTHPCVVGVTRHWVAVSGWQFCDTMSKGEVIEADEARGRRARVDSVFVITGRVPPSHFPRKD